MQFGETQRHLCKYDITNVTVLLPKKKKTFYVNTVECLRLSLLIVCPFYYEISNILVAFHREKTFAYNFLTKMWQGFLWQCPFNRGKYINARSATKPWGNSHSEQMLIVRTCRVRIHSLISLKVCKIYIINRYSYIAPIISNKIRRNFLWERFSISLETMFFFWERPSTCTSSLLIREFPLVIHKSPSDFALQVLMHNVTWN